MILPEPLIIRAFVCPVGQPRVKATGRTGSDGKVVTRVYTPKTRKRSTGERVSLGIQEMKDALRSAVLDLGITERLEGPVRVDILAVFHRQKNKRYAKKEWNAYPHTSRPDLDNIAKGILDGLTGKEPGHLWENDTYICMGEWVKIHAARETEQVILRIQSIDPDEDITPDWALDLLCRTPPSSS